MVRLLIGACAGLAFVTVAWAQTPRAIPAPIVLKKVDVQAASRPVGALMARKMRERGEEPRPTAGDRIDGYLAKPDGDGPFPAVVILPDCIGVTPFLCDTLPTRLASLGYVSLVLDSKTSRNAQAGCQSGREPPGVDRIGDAHGGFHVAGLPFVQRDRVGLLGFATGSTFVLTLAEPQTRSSVVNPENIEFRTGVAYYPLCAGLGLVEKTTFPLLILVGRDDQRTLARACEEVARPASAGSNSVDVHVYSGVKHGFADPHWGAAGEVVGYPTAYDAAAAEDSLMRVGEFLNRTLAATVP
jgi:dienelactone hydrolase